ncbi:MAG TPA: hypothetical protein VHS78_10990 [Candidatus Elarobacter sp.]|jgi:hypothetical protein|nr:hypothetical protein [Candidatus Elarobacter sp.]
MPIDTRFDDLDLREEPSSGDNDQALLGSSGLTIECGTRLCCTCPPA